MTRRAEYKKKLKILDRFLDDHDLDGLILTRRGAFAWATAGGDNTVVSGSDVGLSSFVYDGKTAAVLTTNIEEARIADEEIADLPGLAVAALPWYFNDSVLDAFLASTGAKGRSGRARFASDTNVPGSVPLPATFDRLTWSLLEPEAERYRALGRDAARAIEAACLAVRPGMSEWRIAAELDLQVRERGAYPIVNLVAVDDRIRRYRHPLPTKARFKRSAMLVLCAQRHGLVASCTRLVHVGKPGADLLRRHFAAVEVDVALNDATRIDAVADSIFARALAVYESLGFGDEWRLHHQGGAAGYAPRTWVAKPGCAETVLENQAFAWNPSVTGTKSEDTILATKDGPEFLTKPGRDWPCITIKRSGRSYRRPDILSI